MVNNGTGLKLDIYSDFVLIFPQIIFEIGQAVKEMDTSKNPLLVNKERASRLKIQKTVKSLRNFDSIVFGIGKQRQTKFFSTRLHPKSPLGLISLLF